MFSELMPLIQSRNLTITVVALGKTKLRVNVIPQPTDKDKQANEKVRHNHEKEVAKIPETAISGLTTPLCLTGTPEELDAGLPETLQKYTASHVSLQQSFDTAASAITQAVNAIDERERLKKDKDKANASTKKTPKPEEKKEEPGLPSLFTAPAAVSANEKAAPSTEATENSRLETEGEE
jgi:PRTRC genetic system protein E